MRLSILLLFSILSIAPNPGAFAAEQSKQILKYYPYIQEISNGPIIWHKDTSNPYDLGQMHRAVLVVQEIYYGLIVETYKVMDEGGFEYQYHKETHLGTSYAEFEFVSWLTPKSFKIRIGSEFQKVDITESGEIVITAIK